MMINKRKDEREEIKDDTNSVLFALFSCIFNLNL